MISGRVGSEFPAMILGQMHWSVASDSPLSCFRNRLIVAKAGHQRDGVRGVDDPDTHLTASTPVMEQVTDLVRYSFRLNFCVNSLRIAFVVWVRRSDSFRSVLSNIVDRDITKLPFLSRIAVPLEGSGRSFHPCG